MVKPPGDHVAWRNGGRAKKQERPKKKGVRCADKKRVVPVSEVASKNAVDVRKRAAYPIRKTTSPALFVAPSMAARGNVATSSTAIAVYASTNGQYQNVRYERTTM